MLPLPDTDPDRVARPDTDRLVLLSFRRALGVSAFLMVVYVTLALLTDYPMLGPEDAATILGVVTFGTALGVAFSFVAPLPADMGLARVIRTTLLLVPALGIGVALQIFLKGAQSNMAIYAIFALAAWLGSMFVREIPTDDVGAADADDLESTEPREQTEAGDDAASS